MRSFLIKAAIAAALVSISLPAAYAAQSASTGARATATGAVGDATIHTSGSSVGDTSISRSGAFVAEDQGEADRVPPVMIFPRWSMAGPSFHRGARLATIQSELSRARHAINADRRRGELTRREASFALNEEASVRAEVIDVARANRGGIPLTSYAMLQDRVSDLNRTINRYAMNMARG
jgi:hypothetical protein